MAKKKKGNENKKITKKKKKIEGFDSNLKNHKVPTTPLPLEDNLQLVVC